MAADVTWWTPERDAELRRLLRLGLHSRAIAERLGATRNAVIGYAYRNGIERRDPQTADKHRLAFESLAPAILRACRTLEYQQRPKSSWDGLCATPTCRNTRQRGRDHCAGCLNLAMPARARARAAL